MRIYILYKFTTSTLYVAACPLNVIIKNVFLSRGGLYTEIGNIMRSDRSLYQSSMSVARYKSTDQIAFKVSSHYWEEFSSRYYFYDRPLSVVYRMLYSPVMEVTDVKTILLTQDSGDAITKLRSYHNTRTQEGRTLRTTGRSVTTIEDEWGSPCSYQVIRKQEITSIQ